MSGGYLGSRDTEGFLNPDNPIVPGAYSAKFTPADLYPANFVVYHMALLGPGGRFRVYLDDRFYSASPRGDINEYDPTHPMFVRSGQTIWFHWEVSTGTVPSIVIYSRTPGEVLG